MQLAEYYFGDPRLVLVPIEHLSPGGVSDDFADAVAERAGWSADQIARLHDGFRLYWQRTGELARRTSTWAPPRLRHIAVLREPLAMHPYAQLLNASAWTLYTDDLTSPASHPEWIAYLLAHGERCTQLGEVTMAALHNAAWWLERSPAECAAFAAAAAASQRPDGDAFRALAAALPWLQRLFHAHLRPAPAGRQRAIPNSALLVPTEIEAQPPRLVEQWTHVARAATDAYAAAWRAPDTAALDTLCAWLDAAAPPLLLTCRGDPLWDPSAPARTGRLRSELRIAGAAALRDVLADLRCIERHTRRFLASIADLALLPLAGADAEQRGYTYMHRARRLLVYDLDEPGIDRRVGPALPYARAMLGARAAHEWAHLAVDAGWVPLAVASEILAARVAALAQQLDTAIAAAPAACRAATRDDLAELRRGAPSAGDGLAHLLLRRMPDYQANLVAVAFMDEAERETYVRQNVRTLRGTYPPAQLWRMLLRYLYEYQYLRFSAVASPASLFLRSTWCDADFIDSGILRLERFTALAVAVAEICDCYAVDRTRFPGVAFA